MIYQVTTQASTWNLSPSGIKEVLQNVRCILLTAKGSVWNYRDFGISTELIDKPLPVARNRFLAEVVRQVQKYEPRAKVKSIRWVADEASDGMLKPVVTIELRE